MTVTTDLRALCVSDGVEEAARAVAGRDVDAVAAALARPVPALPPGTHDLDVVDDTGAPVPTRIHVPLRRRATGPSVLLALHGAGSDGETFARQVRPLAEACGMVAVCPTATAQRDGEANLDLSGLLGRRFRGHRWTYGPDEAAMAALRRGCAAVGAHTGEAVLLGTSMGGIAVWNLALRRGWQVAAVVVVNGAPSMWEVFGRDASIDALLPNLDTLPMTLVHGSRDAQVPPRLAQDALHRLRARGHADAALLDVPDGEHGWDSLGLVPGSPQLAALAARITAAASRPRWPLRVEHRAVADDHGRAHWVALSGIAPGAPARVVAEVVGPRAIRVETSGAAALRVHLAETLVVPGPVDLLVDGRRHVVEFRPDPVTLLRSWSADGGAGGPAATFAVDIDLTCRPEGDRR